MRKHCAIITPPQPPLYTDLLKQELTNKEITATCYSWNDIEYKNVFDIKNNQTVIITDANNCPAFLPNMVSEFLKQGGNIVTLGGPPFANEFYNKNNEEIDIHAIKKLMTQGAFDKTVILPFHSPNDLLGFEKDTYNPDSKKYEGDATLSLVEEGFVSSHCLKYHTNEFMINESFEKEIQIKKGHNVIGFYAKADENTKTITISLIQTNGDMFKTRITPSTNFQFFMLSKKEFVYYGNRQGIHHEKRPVYVNFDEVCKIQFGHALSFAYSVAGEHAFYIDELSSAHIAILNDEKVSIDGLYPEYKFCPVTNAVKLQCYEKQAFLSQSDLELPSDLFSLSPRAQSTGIDKQRRFRFVPLIEALDEHNQRCGYAAYMFLNYNTSNRKSLHNKSTIVAYTTNDYNFYESGGALSVAEAVDSIFMPVVLLEGGSNEYIYLEDDTIAAFGAVVCVRDKDLADSYHVRIQVGNKTRTYDLNELSHLENKDGLDLRLIAFEDTPQETNVSVSLIKDETVYDILTHDIIIHHPKPIEERKFAHIQKGENEIYIGDKPVRFFGVNYMPTCNIGMETGEEFEHYVASFAYDPDIIEADLKRICDVGLNAVSIFMHYNPSIHSNNILHLVSLCEKYGLYADLAIRPNANPFEFNEKEVKEMITKYGFQENDTIVAYDIAWERYLGTYEPCYGNFNGRKSLDADWRQYILNRYGSVKNAEKIWQYRAPRNDKNEVIGVTDDMLREDGPHNAMVAAYRNFADGIVAFKHIKAMQYMKSIDPNHMISPRTGDASTIPLVDPGIYGYDYKALASSMEFMSPESYALSDSYKSMRQGIFTNIYSRYANPDNVVIWKEFGKSIWIGSNFVNNHKSEEFQAEYYRRFFDMLIQGHTAGLYAWWWAGGYRIGENSDFGIIAPDGSDRPVTKVFREYADKFIHAPAMKKPELHIIIDRDLHANGLMAMYQEMEQELFGAVEAGTTVAFVDGGTGKTSADVALIEVGNLEPCGCVPKYLNCVISDITVSFDGKKAFPVKNGDIIFVDNHQAMTISVTAVNTEKATWLSGDSFGSVLLKTTDQSDFAFESTLHQNVASLEFVTNSITIPCKKDISIEFAFCAKDRTFFGERMKLKLK
ncbi:hypothetical protein RBG61_02745 [Paludicola sp. MB14-C6]|uniref:hypothetical protein n=1 Tax=Paludihabitans sp. MB14-C6 TaxID=3070656 RepID=UPI0027DD7AD9|nr:hypothetical protein [Paludicola sp. MB14-C6]WMJ23602.1 hypothetical protein RBG61_02745 [Paludicola sp. MB14-C6]